MAQAKIKNVLMTEIKKILLKKGYSISSWARKRGHDEDDVFKYMHRYAAKPQLPRSPEVYAILSDLYEDTGINLMKTSGRIAEA